MTENKTSEFSNLYKSQQGLYKTNQFQKNLFPNLLLSKKNFRVIKDKVRSPLNMTNNQTNFPYRKIKINHYNSSNSQFI